MVDDSLTNRMQGGVKVGREMIGDCKMSLERPNQWIRCTGGSFFDQYTKVSCFGMLVEKERGERSLKVAGFQQHAGSR